MKDELAKELKDAGFPQHELGEVWHPDNCTTDYCVPTLEELILACGDSVTIRLQSYYSGNDFEWQADTCGNFQDWDSENHKAEIGKTPTEAVARLWLALNKKV